MNSHDECQCYPEDKDALRRRQAKVETLYMDTLAGRVLTRLDLSSWAVSHRINGNSPARYAEFSETFCSRAGLVIRTSRSFTSQESSKSLKFSLSSE